MFRSAFVVMALLITAVVAQVQSEAPRSGHIPISDRSRPRADLYGDPLPPGALARLGTVRFRQYLIRAAAWSPDGKMLAATSVSSSDGQIRLWDVAAGTEVRRMDGGTGDRVLAWSPDGKMLASAYYDDHDPISVWDVATGKEIRQLIGHKDYGIQSLAWSPDSKTLASGGDDETARLWDVATGRQIRQLAGQKNPVGALAWSPDGKTLASGSSDHIRLWDTSTGKNVRRLTGHTDSVYWLGWSPDGKLLASASVDQTVRFWQPATGKVLQTLGDAHSASWSPDGSMLACTSTDGTTRLREAQTGKELRRIAARYALWSPDGTALASIHSEAIRLWDPYTGKEIRARDGHECFVSAVCWSPDGKAVASGSGDGTVRLWDPTTGKQVRVLNGGPGWVQSVAWSPDGRTLASGNEDHRIRLWNPATGVEIRQLPGDEVHWVGAVAWSPDGKTLASGSTGKTIRLWNAASGQEIRRFACATHDACGLAWSPDGRTVAVVGSNSIHRGEDGARIIQMLDVASGKEVHRLVHADHAASVAWSPDGQMLASSSWDKTIRLWSAATGETVRRIIGNDAEAPSLAWSPDGKLVAAASGTTIRLWEAVTGIQVRQLSGHKERVESLAWSPDGKRLASASGDTTLLIWGIYDHPDEPPLRLQLSELHSCWTDLAGSDPARVQPAIRILTRGARDSIPFLAERLKPAPSADPRAIARLIDELDNNRYAVRQHATDELEKLNEQAGPALRRALSTRPSLDKRRCLERLLKGLNEWSGGQVRGQRAVTVLETAGTAEARAVLESLAKGAPEDRLTQEAQASLRRLARRQAESSVDR